MLAFSVWRRDLVRAHYSLIYHMLTFFWAKSVFKEYIFEGRLTEKIRVKGLIDKGAGLA